MGRTELAVNGRRARFKGFGQNSGQARAGLTPIEHMTDTFDMAEVGKAFAAHRGLA